MRKILEQRRKEIAGLFHEMWRWLSQSDDSLQRAPRTLQTTFLGWWLSNLPWSSLPTTKSCMKCPCSTLLVILSRIDNYLLRLIVASVSFLDCWAHMLLFYLLNVHNNYFYLQAGQETSTSVLSFTLNELALHPDIVEKMYTEVVGVCGLSGDISFEHVGELRFMLLHCIVKLALTVVFASAATRRWSSRSPCGCGQ